MYKISHSKNYIEHIKTKHSAYLNTPASNSSLLMSYDFHINSSGEPKLIEINTNSSGYLISDLLHQTHELPKNNNILQLKSSFEREWKSFSGQAGPPSETLIADHKIKDQKMYAEFLMYRDLLSSWGWPGRLCEVDSLKLNTQRQLEDPRRPGKPIRFIYNRSTDFYFEGLPHLKQTFLTQNCCISPHPREYLLLADKARLCEWSSDNFLNKIDISSEEKSQIRHIFPSSFFCKLLFPGRVMEKKKNFFFQTTDRIWRQIRLSRQKYFP